MMHMVYTDCKRFIANLILDECKIYLFNELKP